MSRPLREPEPDAYRPGDENRPGSPWYVDPRDYEEDELYRREVDRLLPSYGRRR